MLGHTVSIEGRAEVGVQEDTFYEDPPNAGDVNQVSPEEQMGDYFTETEDKENSPPPHINGGFDPEIQGFESQKMMEIRTLFGFDA